jgi:hypothetical protein
MTSWRTPSLTESYWGKLLLQEPPLRGLCGFDQLVSECEKMSFLLRFF